MTDDRLQLQLTRSQALVLFEWLSRVDENQTALFEDEAEQSVLWALEAMLEKQLTEQFAPNYAELLTRARQAVRGLDE